MNYQNICAYVVIFFIIVFILQSVLDMSLLCLLVITVVIAGSIILYKNHEHFVQHTNAEPNNENQIQTFMCDNEHLRKFNPQQFAETTNTINKFFEIYKKTDAQNVVANITELDRLRRAAQRSFYSLIFSVPSGQLYVTLINKNTQILSNILTCKETELLKKHRDVAKYVMLDVLPFNSYDDMFLPVSFAP